MSQVIVADAVGISRSALAMIESGGDNPGRETLLAIADYFGASLDWLEGRLHKITTPGFSQVIDDPDELALVNFWRGLTTDQRRLMLNMLRRPASEETAA